MVNTVYFPISDYTDAQKNELDKNLRQEFSEFESLDFCNIEYSSGYDYYRITATFKDLENLENIQTLCAIDEIEVDNTDSLISMKKLKKVYYPMDI